MYEIKVLDSEQFDEVARSDPRYSYVDESNMGFADRQKGIAYVRQTHLHDLNKFLINHELEELEEDESTHEDPNGIRHKKFRDFFRALIPGQLFVQSAHKASEEKKAAERQQSEMAQFLGSQQGVSTPQATGPLGQFSTPGAASPRLPDFASGGIGAGGQGNLDPELLQRLKGFFSGRIPF